MVQAREEEAALAPPPALTLTLSPSTAPESHLATSCSSSLSSSPPTPLPSFASSSSSPSSSSSSSSSPSSSCSSGPVTQTTAASLLPQVSPSSPSSSRSPSGPVSPVSSITSTAGDVVTVEDLPVREYHEEFHLQIEDSYPDFTAVGDFGYGYFQEDFYDCHFHNYDFTLYDNQQHYGFDSGSNSSGSTNNNRNSCGSYCLSGSLGSSCSSSSSSSSSGRYSPRHAMQSYHHSPSSASPSNGHYGSGGSNHHSYNHDYHHHHHTHGYHQQHFSHRRHHHYHHASNGSGGGGGGGGGGSGGGGGYYPSGRGRHKGPKDDPWLRNHVCYDPPSPAYHLKVGGGRGRGRGRASPHRSCRIGGGGSGGGGGGGGGSGSGGGGSGCSGGGGRYTPSPHSTGDSHHHHHHHHLHHHSSLSSSSSVFTSTNGCAGGGNEVGGVGGGGSGGGDATGISSGDMCASSEGAPGALTVNVGGPSGLVGMEGSGEGAGGGSGAAGTGEWGCSGAGGGVGDGGAGGGGGGGVAACEGSGGQYVVHFHINPGTTVNFQTGDGHVQRISGPATVRMVSANPSPPIPLPVQVPPGHMVQQIVDETGTLRHVILSTQPMPMQMCPYGPNAGQPTPPPQFYGAPPPPQGYVATYQPPPPQFSPHMSPPLSQTSPPPHNFHKPDRAKQHDKPRPKVQQRYQKPTCNSLHSTPPHSPKKELFVKKAEEEEYSNVDEEDSQVEPTILPQIKPPTISEILPRSATLHWLAPEWKEEGRENCVSDLRYEVYVNGNLETTVTTTHITLDKLRPATEYQVYLVCVTDTVRGTETESQSFTTLSTVPDTPAPPRCVQKYRSSILLRWVAAKENGSKITAYCLELCSGGSEWREVFRGKGKQYTINKLQPQTSYRVRLVAFNEHGKSEYSEETEVCTSGSPPSQPQPVGLEKPGINTLILTWSRRQQDESFTLQMEDALNGYGFRVVYDGRDTRYVCRELRRNADYKFRLCTHNEAGASPFSDIACYRTLPDRPKPPSVPTLKGRPHPTRLVITWNPPVDHGGSPVSVYRAEMDHGEGFVCVYTGELCECECQNLKPGTSYHVRVNGTSSGGVSDWSPVATLCTEAVCPTQCQAPKLVGKPKASTLQLRWGFPEYDGGAQVTQFEIDMTSPDNERRQVYCGRDTECTVASLLPGRPYIFLVRAVNRIGAGAWSEPLEVVSGAGPPDAPHTPQLTCRAPHTVHVAWEEPINNGAGIEQYTVQVAEVSCPHAESSESSSTCGDMESDLTFNTAHTGHSTTAEVRNLNPATTYAFRIQASNSAGSGPWSAHSMVTTPAAPPAPVAYLSASPAATSITLLWGEPANHGDPITHYVIEVADKTFTTPGLETEYTVTDLLPETLYKVRIQAVNSVGPGGFSAVTKVTTRALPPSPPHLELVKASHNSLRLKWGDGRNADMITYYLQMEFSKPHSNTTEFYNIYRGTNQNYKVGKLEENTTYRLRICASNEAGDGPFSPIVEMTTTKAPPNPVKPPRAIECPGMTYRIEWSAVKCRGDDPIQYRLQVLQAGKDKDYSVVYTGSETSYTLTELEPSTWYNVRVCGVRVCEDGETMAGAFSTPAVFNTPKPVLASAMTTPVHTTKESSFHWRDLSDQHKALTILFGFSLVAIIIALGVQHFLSPQATTR